MGKIVVEIPNELLKFSPLLETENSKKIFVVTFVVTLVKEVSLNKQNLALNRTQI